MRARGYAFGCKELRDALFQETFFYARPFCEGKGGFFSEKNIFLKKVPKARAKPLDSILHIR